MSETVIAIDPGYNMGWCVFTDGTRVASGTYVSGKFSKAQGGRFFFVSQHLAQLINDYKPTRIVFEHVYRWASSDAALAYNGVLSEILAQAWKANIPTRGYSPATIKKQATGNGKATKPEMIAKANELYNISCVDDNEADAILLGRLDLASSNDHEQTVSE